MFIPMWVILLAATVGVCFAISAAGYLGAEEQHGQALGKLLNELGEMHDELEAIEADLAFAEDEDERDTLAERIHEMVEQLEELTA
jgi:hypothetical protein